MHRIICYFIFKLSLDNLLIKFCKWVSVTYQKKLSSVFHSFSVKRLMKKNMIPNTSWSYRLCSWKYTQSLCTSFSFPVHPTWYLVVWLTEELSIHFCSKTPWEPCLRLLFFFFWQCLNLFSNPFTKTEGKVACVLLFTGLCLASVSKCINRFAITWASAALYPPHAQVAALMGFIMRRCSAGAERLSWAAVGNNNTGQRMATMWAVPDCKQPMDWGLDMPDISRT